METLKIEKNNVKMIAHRGLSGLEKENTAVAFVAAGNKSFYGIETDIHLTKDNVFVISHDAHTGRVSPVKFNIKDLTFSELQKIDLYDFESKETKSYLKYPSLKDYLTICKKYEKHCVIEMKPEFSPKEIQKLLDEIYEVNKLENTTLISFNLTNLKRVRRINKTIPLQYLTSTYTDDLPKLCKKEKVDIDILYNQLTPESFKAFKDLGIKINAWTVNNPIEALVLVSWEIDYITTNILE